MRSKSEDHLLHATSSPARADRDSCCNERCKDCCDEECDQSFYLHDPSTVGYNRLCDLFPQTSSDDSGLCLNSSSNNSPKSTNYTQHSSNHNSQKFLHNNGFSSATKLSDSNSISASNKMNGPFHINQIKSSNNSKDGSNSRRVLTRPRRAAPLPPIPTASRNFDKREDSGNG